MTKNMDQAIELNRQASDAVDSGLFEKAKQLIEKLEAIWSATESLYEANVINDFIDARWEQLENA